jgi:hypothetical protein
VDELWLKHAGLEQKAKTACHIQCYLMMHAQENPRDALTHIDAHVVHLLKHQRVGGTGGADDDRLDGSALPGALAFSPLERAASNQGFDPEMAKGNRPVGFKSVVEMAMKARRKRAADPPSKHASKSPVGRADSWDTADFYDATAGEADGDGDGDGDGGEGAGDP